MEKSQITIITCLLVITLVVTALQEFALDRTLVLDSQTHYRVEAVDDRVNGGASVAKLYRTDRALIMECELIKVKDIWPFCEVDIFLTPQGQYQGIDFSMFDRVGLWVYYEADSKAPLRFHVRNFNDRYSKEQAPSTFKYNSVEFPTGIPELPVWVPMESFQVATWWVVENNIPISDVGPDFDNVVSLELATGTYIDAGHYRLNIERIAFEGKWIHSETVYMFLIALWVVSALVYVTCWICSSRRALQASRLRQQELESINRILNIKSRQLEEQVSHDPLTGVLNRDGLQKVFYEGMNKRTGDNGLCIIFMDIDHFKRINDEYGHPTGDQVLREFAALVSGGTRTTDVLARWGGEEFILACPNTDLDRAYRLAEKLRETIAAHNWPENMSVTCSFGVALMGRESPASFIERTDKALYTAKARGRNCVVVASDSQSSAA